MHVREELGVDHQDLPSPVTGRGRVAADVRGRRADPAAALPGRVRLAGRRAEPRGLAAFAGGGLVARITDRPFLRGARAAAGAGRRRHRAHLRDRHHGRRRGLLSSARPAPGCAASGPAARLPGFGAERVLGLAAARRDSSSRSASTIMATSSSKPIFGSQPSSSRALDGSAHSWSTSAGRMNAASHTTWSRQSRPATPNASSHQLLHRVRDAGADHVVGGLVAGPASGAWPARSRRRSPSRGWRCRLPSRSWRS